MAKCEDEAPLIDQESPVKLNKEDAGEYFEAFHQFDHKNTGMVSIRVRNNIKQASMGGMWLHGAMGHYGAEDGIGG